MCGLAQEQFADSMGNASRNIIFAFYNLGAGSALLQKEISIIVQVLMSSLINV